MDSNFKLQTSNFKLQKGIAATALNREFLSLEFP
jgi:hypothetical protein